MLPFSQLNAYNNKRIVQTAMTAPSMSDSLRFLILMRWIKLFWDKGKLGTRCCNIVCVSLSLTYLDIIGNRLDISCIRVWKRFKCCRCEDKCSFVSIAILIWSFTRELELWRWVFSFRYISLRLSPDVEGEPMAEFPKPEPRRSSSRSMRVVWLAWIFRYSCRYPWNIKQRNDYNLVSSFPRGAFCRRIRAISRDAFAVHA